MARAEVIAGPERRRRWSDEQKRAIVAASLAPGAVVSEVAVAPISVLGRFIAGVRSCAPPRAALRRC
jgi:Transposase